MYTGEIGHSIVGELITPNSLRQANLHFAPKDWWNWPMVLIQAILSLSLYVSVQWMAIHTTSSTGDLFMGSLRHLCSSLQRRARPSGLHRWARSSGSIRRQILNRYPLLRRNRSNPVENELVGCCVIRLVALPGVNFTNILWAAVSCKSVLRSFSLITVWLCNFLMKEYWCKSCL